VSKPRTRRCAVPALLALLALVAGCAGDEPPPAGGERASPSAAAPAAPTVPPAGIRVDETARTVVVPAAVSKQGQYAQLRGVIEYVLVAEGGKQYETLFLTPHRAEEIHQALARLGLRRGRPATAERLPRGQAVTIEVEYEAGGKTARRPVATFLTEQATDKAVGPGRWIYTGSEETRDPGTGAPLLAASLTQSIVGLHTGDASSLVQNAEPASRAENFYRAAAEALPPTGTPVRLHFGRPAVRADPARRRVHALFSGRVQDVGFCEFAERSARMLDLVGFVQNLGDGRVESVVEGPAEKVADLLQRLKQGPRAARVEGVVIAEEPLQADFETFDYWN